MTMKRKRDWFDDEAFWRDTYPFMFPPGRIAATPEQIQQVLALTKPAGKAVLDLCCGPGRCAVELARKRFSVTGVDKTSFLLKKARARARSAGVAVEWVLSDMRDFVRPGAFDLAISMFTSFGYFEDREEDVAVLANAFASLRPNGAFLVDVFGKEGIAERFLPAAVDRLPDGTVLVEDRRVVDDWSRIRNEWTIIRNGRAKKYAFHVTVYSGQELRDRMEQVGFRDVRLYGDLSGAPYGRGARRLIAVGRKPGKARKRR